jgi:hypothetical protein
VVNRYLRKDPESRQRGLYIRTYVSFKCNLYFQDIHISDKSFSVINFYISRNKVMLLYSFI